MSDDLLDPPGLAASQGESPLVTVAGSSISLGVPPPNPSKKKSRTPKSLTPHLRKILRMLASGRPKADVVRECNSSVAYVNRCLSEGWIRAEYDKLCKAVEEAFITSASDPNAANRLKTETQNRLSVELDQAVLDAVNELRNILRNSKSDSAKAKAASEILDLAQAKKRLSASLDQNLDGEADVTKDDVSALASCMKDIRLMHMKRGVGSGVTSADSKPKPPAETDYEPYLVTEEQFGENLPASEDSADPAPEEEPRQDAVEDADPLPPEKPTAGNLDEFIS